MPLLMILLLLLSGCMNVTAHTMPVNPDVKPVIEGSDCVPMIMGFSYGTATVEQAMRDANVPIVRLHSVALHDYGFFLPVLWAMHCVEVTGEGATSPATPTPEKKSLTPEEYYKQLEEQRPQ